MSFIHLRNWLFRLGPIIFLLTLHPWQNNPVAAPAAFPQPGCTTIYAYDGQSALGGNNEDFMNPLAMIWFIPASPGRFGRVYFGYDDYIPQGGLNDQGVFFDGLALPYKEMPIMNKQPTFPGDELAWWDEILSRSANVQDAIEMSRQWKPIGGEFGQYFYGDRFGNSVIIDGDTVIPGQGAYQLATNFRLVDYPDPPHPDARYDVLDQLFSGAGQYSVDFFRQALDAAHAEGDFPTVYSQVYELDKGNIHLYLYHDFEHEVVLNLAEELAKGPHVATLASLFPENEAYEAWAAQQVDAWRVNAQELVDDGIDSDRLSWMSGDYVMGNEGEAVEIYLEDDQLYLQRPNQLRIELYPAGGKTVVHRFFNGIELSLTFERNLWGQVSGARGMLGFAPYGITSPYRLTRPGVVSFGASLLITSALAAGIVSLFSVPYFRSKRRRRIGVGLR